jgi:hypothetical protein
VPHLLNIGCSNAGLVRKCPHNIMAEAVHIGMAAKVADVSVDTIRFYQKLGLIKSASCSAEILLPESIRYLT